MSNFESNVRNLSKSPLKMQFTKKCNDDNFAGDLLVKAANNVKL
jgi:hypothetical protein